MNNENISVIEKLTQIDRIATKIDFENSSISQDTQK
jgi:hypothetical protein